MPTISPGISSFLANDANDVPKGSFLAWASAMESAFIANKFVVPKAGAPVTGDGFDGDIAIDYTNARLYLPKTAGAWGSYVSLIGPAGLGYGGTSTASLTTSGTGSVTFTTGTGLGYGVGSRVRLASAGTGEWMEGTVTAYNSGTGAMTIALDKNSGTAVHADWNLSVAGMPGANGAGTGTVTSVGVSMSTEFTVSSSPITAAGTIVIGKANQSPNTVWAGPASGGAAAPGFRALVIADIVMAGVANGLATLDSGGKVPVSQLPASVIGGMNYQGGWNASTNSPALVSSTGTKGYYYKVSTTGTTTLDGISQWDAGDYVTFNGTVWDKIQGTGAEIISVAGLVGTITAAALKSALSIAVADITGLAASATTDTTNAGNIASGTLNAARLPTTAMQNNATSAISKGFTLAPNNLGTVTTGTTTLDPAQGNYQYMTNNGASTIAAPASDCAIDILITNGASAGALTMSGFTVGSNTGSAYVTTSAAKFILSVRRINGVSTFSWYALQ